jgi:hypothetical protein
MTSRRLAYLGIAGYGLSVLASATGRKGESASPTLLLALAALVTVTFLVAVVLRLWRTNRSLAIVLAASQLGSLALQGSIGPTPYGGSVIAASNLLKVIALISLMLVITTLFRQSEATHGPNAQEAPKQTEPVSTPPRVTRGLPAELIDADKVVGVWGKYLECCQDRLSAVFLGGIPESLLPYPVQVIEDALNDMARYYHSRGDHDAVAVIQGVMGPLASYRADRDALANAAKTFSTPAMEEIVLERLRAVQRRWILTQN